MGLCLGVVFAVWVGFCYGLNVGLRSIGANRHVIRFVSGPIGLGLGSK